MKKIIKMLFVATAVLALVGCGNTTSGSSSSSTPAEIVDKMTVAQTLLKDFKDKRTSKPNQNILELAQGIMENEAVSFASDCSSVEEGFLPGFDADIVGFASAVRFGPLINVNPFIGYIFQLKDETNVATFMQNLKDHGNLNWGICVMADEMVVGNVDKTVFFVMSPTYDETN